MKMFLTRGLLVAAFTFCMALGSAGCAENKTCCADSKATCCCPANCDKATCKKHAEGKCDPKCAGKCCKKA